MLNEFLRPEQTPKGRLYTEGLEEAFRDKKPRGWYGLAISNELEIVRRTKCEVAADRLKRVVKLLGMVNSSPHFEKHALIVNGCSELFVQLMGEENGIGVRSAVGMGSLPGNVAVEVEGLFELFAD